jgi:hypothetical protein
VAKLRAELDELLSGAEVETFFKRIDVTLQKGSFPPMSSRRAVPWPWY